MNSCPNCAANVEAWEVTCHQCQASVGKPASAKIQDIVPVKAELQEAYANWLEKGKTALKDDQLEEACNALREAIKRSGPLDNAQEKETVARKALAEALEKLNKLQEAADQYRIIAQDSSSTALREAWLKKSQDLVASAALPYDLLFQKEEFRPMQGAEELLIAQLYCAGCRRLLAEAEVYGLRRGAVQTVRCWCGVEGQPLVKQDISHSLTMKDGRSTTQISQRAVAIHVASKPIPGGRNKRTAVFLAFFTGWCGGHKFYLGETTAGWIYALWCWTLIPFLVSLYEGLMLMEMNITSFNMTYNIELVLNLIDSREEQRSKRKADVFGIQRPVATDVDVTTRMKPLPFKPRNDK
jgi:TM2 domain-containing membrane protein YozV